MSKITQEMNESVFYRLVSEEFRKLRICSPETEKRMRIEYQLIQTRDQIKLENYWREVINKEVVPILPRDSDKLMAEVHIVKTKKLPVHRIIFDCGFCKYDFIVFKSAKTHRMSVGLKTH